jgi:3',5'-cyclic-AMP phosphodiesterase
MSLTQKIWDPAFVSWVHFGDLHLTRSAEENYRDFLELIEHANGYLRDGVDFAVLPGDNTENGTEEQYELLRTALAWLQIPVHIIPGDHDVKSGSLEVFRKYLASDLYRSFRLGDYHLVFLDAVDGGTEGNFGIGQAQLDWLTTQLDQATSRGLKSVLFLHTYPSKLIDGGDTVRSLLRRHRVLLVDMGHTHYNELSNDGTTIYAATRSTGQIEEGPPGFSIITLDHDVVSWKFKELGSWPFVMITSPADKNLITDPSKADQLVRGEVRVRARIWDESSVRVVVASIDDRPSKAMYRSNRGPYWSVVWNSAQVSNGEHVITVRAADFQGHTAEDRISVLVNQAGSYDGPVRKSRDEENAIGAYPSKGILGTRLGPNKNGTKGPWPSWSDRRHFQWFAAST